MMITIARIEIFRGTATSILVTTDRCPCCGSAVRVFELELEVSGLPVTERTECTHCEWSQGWDPEVEWVNTPDFPPAPAEVICTAG